MATIVRYVNTAAASGGNGTTNNTTGADRAYNSLSAAEAGLRQNLTTVTPDVADQDGATTIALRIYVNGSSADTTQVTFSNATWVTDATHRIEIILLDGAQGPKWNSSVYRLSTSPGYAVGSLRIGKAIHMDLVDLQIENTSTLDNSPFALELQNFASDVRVYRGFFRLSSTTGTWDNANVIRSVSTTTSSLKIRNAAVVAANGLAFHSFYTNAAATFLFYNCTFVNRGGTNRVVFDAGNIDTGTTARYKNLIIQGTTGATGLYSASSPDEAVSILTQDASAPGTALDNKTVSFVDSTNWDYHLASGDTSAKDAGTDLSADSAWAFSTDGDGATRSGSWDIGADEVAGGGGGATNNYYYARNQ